MSSHQNNIDHTPLETNTPETMSVSLAMACRQNTKRLIRWRIAFFVLLFIGLIGGGSLLGMTESQSNKKRHIGVVSFQSLIIWPQDTIDLIDDMVKAPEVKAIIVRMDSPGGAVTGSEALYKAIKKANEKKPVVVVVETVAASGGYLAALGAQHIVALETSLVGSIGVYMQWYEGEELFKTLGIRPRTLKSSPLKGEPSFASHADERVTRALQEELESVALWFKTIVGQARSLDKERLDRVTDGRVFIGKKALELGLIDGIGGIHEAHNWLETEHSLDGLERIEWRISKDDFFDVLFNEGLSKALASLMLVEPKKVLSSVDKAIQQHSLQGILALWQSGH